MRIFGFLSLFLLLCMGGGLVACTEKPSDDKTQPEAEVVDNPPGEGEEVTAQSTPSRPEGDLRKKIRGYWRIDDEDVYWVFALRRTRFQIAIWSGEGPIKISRGRYRYRKEDQSLEFPLAKGSKAEFIIQNVTEDELVLRDVDDDSLLSFYRGEDPLEFESLVGRWVDIKGNEDFVMVIQDNGRGTLHVGKRRVSGRYRLKEKARRLIFRKPGDDFGFKILFLDDEQLLVTVDDLPVWYIRDSYSTYSSH